MRTPRQASFSELEYASKGKRTRRDKFLADLELLTPWDELIAALKPHYYNSTHGRPPIGLEVMLRMYIVQNCLGLSDEGIEDALYDSQAVRRFVGIDIGLQSAPDATTVLHFRHRLEQNGLMALIMSTINTKLEGKGLLLRRGTIVDATLIAAPSSTKNQSGQRDADMHQTKKGNTWHFGMKAHIGVDEDTGVVHTVVGTAANVHDVTQAHQLLHGKEETVTGDAGYVGAGKREENQGRTNHQGKTVTWHIAMRPGKRKALDTSTHLGQLQESLEQVKAQIRARVEHPFHIIKNLFKHKKTRYKGLEKNTHHLTTLFAMANLMICKNRLKEKIEEEARLAGTGASRMQVMG